MRFEENLLFLRRRAGMTQEQLAEALEVTRQSVSKWESGAGFPELEKLLRLSELFQIDMDTLLKGDAEQCMNEDTCGYDAHMESFNKMIAGGVALIIFGVGAMTALEGLGCSEQLSFAALMMCVIVAVSAFIIAGMRNDQFGKAHPYVQPFYDEKTLEDFHRKFPAYIVGGIALCISAPVWWVMWEGSPHEDLWSSGGFFLVALGVGTLIRGGLLEKKYDIPRYNREHTPEYLAVDERVGRYCAVIMLAATALFLIVLFVFLGFGDRFDNIWIGMAAAAIFSIGGILCGIVSIVLFRKVESGEQEKE